ncbi:MAG: formylmethanofuran dehydrogenase subunit E family protein [Methanoregulaceae archaeon]|nr:formylmethanofuran dehydrogenase subunit E family protein [Methanoregulaceae archaeon]
MKEKGECSLESLERLMDSAGIPGPLEEKFRECVAFHTFPAPGLLIGVFMVDYALELMGADPKEKLYSVSETTKCAPDPLQVILHCTSGNHRLRIIPIGKFAITINRGSAEPYADGMRIFIDPVKLKNFPLIHIWFTNDPSFSPRTMTIPLIGEIFQAGRKILSSERVRVEVVPKQKWKSVECSSCRETVPDNLLHDGVCGGCGPLSYYCKERVC